MKFRHRPSEVEAVQWDGRAQTANAFLGDRFGVDWEYGDEKTEIRVPFAGAWVSGFAGDWLMKAGELVWVVESAMFAELYEAIA